MKHTQRKMIFILVPMLIALGIFSGCKREPKTGDPSQGGPSQNSPHIDCDNKSAYPESLKIFPNDNPWNMDISNSSTDKMSDEIIKNLQNFSLRANFGSGLWEGAPIGIPYSIVCGNEPKRTVIFRKNQYDDNYGHESDPGPYPIPLNAPIENNGKDDAHVIVLDRDNMKLYELYNAGINNGQWEASAGAIFDLNSNTMRPEGWTSADGAGLPIFPGLIKYEEILRGEIKHPIRFTLKRAHVKPGTFVYPARHMLKSKGGPNSLPLGARLRLKSDYDISGFSKTNQIILTAMKKYGLILADQGSNFFISGTPDARWDDEDLSKLRKVKGSNFEVVKFND
ncbi:MAG: hypothetical protein WBP45_16150 [Daejeonella sp.]